MPVIIFITVVNMIAFTTIMPMLPLIQKFYAITDHQVGYVIQLFVACSIVGAIVFGSLSDFLGRKYMLLLASSLSVISYFLAGWTDDFNHFLIYRAISGFCNGSFSVTFAIATDLSSKENRMKNMGAMGAAFATSVVFGPSIGGFATSFGSNLKEMIAIPFYLASAVSFLCVLLIIFLFKESLKKQPEETKNSNTIIRSFLQLLSNKEFLFMTIMNIAYTMVIMTLQIYLGLWLFKDFHLSAVQIGIFWSIGAIFMILTQIAIQKYFYKYSSQNLMVFAFLGMALGYVVLFLSESKLFLLYVAFAIISINSAFLQASISTKLSLSGSEGRHGLVFGISQSLSGFGRVLGPLFGGLLVSHFYYVSSWGIIAILLCVLSLVTFLFFKYGNNAKTN